MIGDFQREHVRHLVPQRAAPMKVAARASRWTVHRDDVPECHTEQANAGKCGHAYGEVIVIGVQLDGHRLARLETVSLREDFGTAPDQIQRVWPQHSCFFLMQAQAHLVVVAADDDGTLCQLEVADAIQQAQRVHGGWAVWIAGISRL
jgi:hypothetical protein